MSMQQGQMQKGTAGVWKGTAAGGILLSAIGFYEPAKDLYQKIYDPDYAGIVSVPFAEHQFKLADKNADCFLNMKRRKVEINQALAISYGACPNDNVHIAVYPKDKPAYQRWIEPNREQDLASAMLGGGGLFSSAHAGISGSIPAAPAPQSNLIPAQIEITNICQEWESDDKRKLVRVTDEAGQCYFERVNALSGVVEVREPAQCETPCAEEAEKYSHIK